MFKKKLLLKKSKNYTLTYSSFSSGMNDSVDDNVLPLRYAKKVYNYSIKKGSLQCGLGIERLKLPKYFENFQDFREVSDFTQGIKNLWHYQFWDETNQRMNHNIIFHGEDGALYILNSVVPITAYFQMFPEQQYSFSGEIYGMDYRLNGEDVMFFTIPSQQKMIVCQDDLINTIYDEAPKLLSICKHYERLFAILEGDRKTLMFSANLDPTNWNAELDEGGFIQMYDERGKLLKLISFNDYVYVFREFGITKISAYGDQEEFSVSHLAISSTKIFPNSITCCGDQVIFLTEDGLYVFNGYTTSKLTLNIEELFKNQNNENCCALFQNNKYYLACRLNFDDNNQVGCESYEGGYVNNALLEYDLATGELNIMRGVDIKKMCVMYDFCYNKIVCCFNGEHKNSFGEITNTGKYFDKVLQKAWVSPYSNMGYPNKIKVVKEIIIKTLGNIKVKIKTDKQEKTYEIKGNPVTQRIKTNVRGELVQISFISDEDCQIDVSSPQITIGVI